ncbi:MAG TPA: FtsW/RodA/SpoVE family cell cycle protein [Pseudothermotoga sp.]|nr:FtsW/RodA/SpoVE family cell cycle protein [Pseudothermotoga sp.]HOK84399.1 FtsW/RodA/SpoVE family cell cycle protein [Pseudothermotoga sp.]HPP70585.1 FtsW/RodA/SpoVE family cell cycle protein [Pseudothermotoga sp.]
MPWENRRIDLFIPIIVALLMIIGLFAIYSATKDYGVTFVKKQITWDILSMAALFLTMLLRERDLQRLAWVLYVICLVALALVLFFGTVSGGARRWFDLRVGYFQPSELAKMCVILVSAVLLIKASMKHMIFSLMALGTMVLLVAVEPDLGTAVLLTVLWLVMAFCSKIPLKVVITVLIIFVAFVPLLYFFGLKDYQKERIISFLSPSMYKQSSSYNVTQSLHTIGSGGLLGRGYLKGLSTTWGYVPKNHTDFILSVIGEEFGFLGVSLCVILYAMLTFRIANAIRLAKNEFWQLIDIGVMTVFVLQIFVNMGMAMGLTPVTGVPLPFISYGGSSTLFFCIQLGLVEKSYAVGKAGREMEGGQLW